MALYKDGKLYGSYSTYGLSKKLGYHEVKNNDLLYSLHINKKGEWMMQVFKWWLHGGSVRMSLKETVYDVNNVDPFTVAEIIVEDNSSIESLPKMNKNVVDINDDDIPF